MIALIGSGPMAEKYLQVLAYRKEDVLVVGRNTEKAQTLAKKYGFAGIGGGAEKLSGHQDCAIVVTGVDTLKDITLTLLNKGIKNILIEKPGALDLKELEHLRDKMPEDATIRIATNRRFYNSTILLRKHLTEDGGAIGLFFDFTDREKDILLDRPAQVTARWGFANSIHVIDTAFHIAGKPTLIKGLRTGEIANHPAGSIFVGHGQTEQCLFSYFATWNGGGRWDIEVSTTKGRYKLSPLEELRFCEKNQFEWKTIEQPDNDDDDFKPGLKKMLTAFLDRNEQFILLPTLTEQMETCNIINSIFGYSP
ncbi:MAG: Gfo/Idh/MocA family oxidoreductase [Nanoarchaeota archaeon]